MRVLPSVLLVVVAVGAAPINMNFQVTPALMDFVCSVVQSPEKAQFNAVWVSQPLCSLSQDAKQQAADYANAFHAGKYPVPHSRDEFMAQIKQYIPLVYPTAESVLAEAVRRWNALTSNGAKDFIAKWEKKAYQNVDVDRVKMFVNIMSDGKEFLADAKALTDADWAALNEQFPQFGAMYNSPKAKAMQSLIENLPDDFDWNADPDTMNQAMQMSLAEFLPKDAQTSK